MYIYDTHTKKPITNPTWTVGWRSLAMALKERSVIKTYHLNGKTIVMLPIGVHYWANIGQCLSEVKISKNCQGSIDVIKNYFYGPHNLFKAQISTICYI